MTSPMKTGHGRRLLVGLVVGAALALIATRILVNLYVEILWQGTLGYLDVYWTRLWWTWGTRLVVGVAVGLLLFLNLRLVVRTFGGIQIKRRFGDLEINEQLPRNYLAWMVMGASGVLGLWFAASVTDDMGLRILLAARAAPWALADPVFGRDVSFYVFILPLLRAAVGFALITLFLLIALCVGGYAATGALRWGPKGVIMGNQPRIHLGALVASFVLLLGAQFWLARYALLQSGNSGVQGIFGFTDAHARLPGLRILAVLAVLAAILLLWGAWKNRLIPVASAVGLLIVGWLVVGQLYPAFLQRFRVEPNELGRESPYIEHALEFTRHGFGLDRMSRSRFEYVRPLVGDAEAADGRAPIEWSEAAEQLDGLPVWTRSTLLTTFNEVEARYRYYGFTSTHIDRYDTPDGREPVAIGVREIDPTGIEDPNWQNLHLRELYITGMGAVAAAASERTPEGRPDLYLAAIPPEFRGGPDAPQGLRLERPSVIIGARPQLYALLNPGDSTFLSPGGTPGVPGTDYPEGIRLDSFHRTLAFAWRFQDANLLFSGELNDSTRFVFRRQVLERVRSIAPFLEYPEGPYPVVHDGRIVWILEGFTATRGFPLSADRPFGFGRSASWIRNSVKVAVDAVSGRVDFYRVPGDDPLLEAWNRAFPQLLQPLDAMPETLRRHLRYPRALLEVQAEVLLQYHQESPARFHGQQDVWAVPRELSRGSAYVPYRPEYGIYRLPGEEEAFHLTTVFAPAGRQNLTGIMAARFLPDGRTELQLFDVPVEDRVPGPRQVEALIEQDPVISEQFSLWRTGGSQVWTGHLHLVPVGRHILYMEAVFLAAEEDAIPQLRGFVVSDGDRVVMEPTLAGSLAVLSGGELDGEAAAETQPSVAGGDPEGAPAAAPLGMTRWPAEALDLLDAAESRLREGDFQGFGEALDELRRLLERLNPPGGPGR